MTRREVVFKIPKKFKCLLSVQSRWVVLKGGAGSGKSHNVAQILIRRCILEPNNRMLFLRKVGRTIRESLYELCKQILVDIDFPITLYKINKTDMTIQFLHNNSKIIFAGLDDPEKIKSIAGITTIWAEEATEFKEDDIEQLNLRLRPNGGQLAQLYLTLNPVSATHWIKKKFFDKLDKDVYLHHSTYKDNPHLPNTYREAIEKLKETNITYYKIYGLGEWGSLKGLIYTNYTIIKQLPQYSEYDILGLDFGYNHPQALIRVKIDGKKAYLDEVYYKTEKENSYMIEYLKKNHSDLFKKECYADAARPDLISECKKAGMRIFKANKDVFSGINTVQGLELYVTERSVNIIKELDSYVWKIDKNGNTLDEPIKEKDDALDAIRYAIHTALYRDGMGRTKSFKMKGL
jgi:phage terminase large subunit